MEQIENTMVVDGFWDEEEYRVPNHRRLKREREAFGQAEYGEDNE